MKLVMEALGLLPSQAPSDLVRMTSLYSSKTEPQRWKELTQELKGSKQREEDPRATNTEQNAQIDSG
jgi:hypothetical protein